MKHIILHIDDKFFFKMKEDKLKRERKLGKILSWEKYTQLLFGFAVRG